MKKLILIAAALFTVNGVINAQEVAKPAETNTQNKKGPNPKRVPLTVEQRAQKSVDLLNSEVTLTEGQKLKVYNLAIERAKQVDVLRVKYKGQSENREVAKKEIEPIRKDYREKVKVILTPEQLEKLKVKQKERKAQGKAEHGEDND